ncbi:MAG: alpha-xylosidase [Opitutaceae bacterium]
MKFTHGHWLQPPGVRAHFAAEGRWADIEADAVTVRAATRPIRHHGDTLQGPMLTVRLSSPLADVVRVRIEHFAGLVPRGPGIPLLAPAAHAVEARKTERGAELRSGSLVAAVAMDGGWSLEFAAGGRTLTRSGARGIGYVEWEGRGRFVHEQLGLGVGECVYGLGERFTAFVKNGQVVENWNEDGGAGCEQAYKSVPFYLTNRGYGVLVNETGPVSFEIGSEKAACVQFSIPGESLEYFLIYGPSPKEILAKLTALTGRPALPPAWSFGLWLTTSFTTDYDEPTVTGIVEEMRQRDIPLHVFHFDCFWMRDWHWCDFQWDARAFPHPEEMLGRLHARGLRVSVWINPYVAQLSPLFAEARAGGYLLRRPNGDVWQTDQWQPGMAIVDFTHPGARDWYAGHLRRLAAMGVDCFKTDFGERIPTDVVYHDGSDPVKMHNHYAVLYNQTVFTALEAQRGRGEALVFARSTHAGGQRFPVHWGGDSRSSFESMAESLRAGLSLGLCGFGYWSHDIGGFEGTPPAALYKRWVAFGLLSSHSRLHGNSTYRVPWNYNGEACDVLRFFTKLKCRLMPYLYGAAVQAHRSGVPMMRAMLVEFPGDPSSEALDRQYMLGEGLLVAPVFSDDGEVEFYLPDGQWTHLLTGCVAAGGCWRRERHDFFGLPLYVRPGAVIALGATDDRPDYDYAEGVRFLVCALAEGAEAACEVPRPNGEAACALRVARLRGVVTAELTGRLPGSWSLQLAGTAGDDPLGAVFTPESGGRTLRIPVPG